MGKISLLIFGCILGLGLIQACNQKPWHSDWNTCPAQGDIYHDLWYHCKTYPNDNICQLCLIPRCHPDHVQWRRCLANPNDRQCSRFRPTNPISHRHGSRSNERRGSGSRQRRRSGSRRRKSGSRRRRSGSRRRRSGSRGKSGSKEKKKCKKGKKH